MLVLWDLEMIEAIDRFRVELQADHHWRVRSLLTSDVAFFSYLGGLKICFHAMDLGAMQYLATVISERLSRKARHGVAIPTTAVHGGALTGFLC